MNKTSKNTKNFKFVSLGAVALLSISACTQPLNLSMPSLSNPLIPKPTEGVNVSSAGGSQIVDRGMYKAVVAGSGDTMATLAARAGVTAEQLASHNGLTTSYKPRNGQEFAIPNESDLTSKPVQESTPVATVPEDSIETSSLGNSDTGTTTHRVKSGETAYSIARLYGVSMTALSSWNKLGPELNVREGQELIIPTGETPNTSTVSIPSTTTTDASPSTGFQRPVSGSVATAYDPANGSQGVVYSTSGSVPVKATAAGKVVLVSESTGANGTIVMVQHSNGLISVYGKLGNASVSKGQDVSAGQTIGTTAGSQLLFQLRKGTASVNPAEYVS